MLFIKSRPNQDADPKSWRTISRNSQQQQLAIARALVLTPRLLILDEPTEGIQPNIVQQIGDIISKLNQELGLTVLVVEQKLPFVKRVTNRFSIMTKGSIVADDEMPALSDALIAEHLSV